MRLARVVGRGEIKRNLLLLQKVIIQFSYLKVIYIYIYIHINNTHINVHSKIGTDLRAEMSKNWGDNAKRKVFFLMFKTEQWAVSNKIPTCPWSENPNLTRHFCNEVKCFCFCGGKGAVLQCWVHPEGPGPVVSHAWGTSCTWSIPHCSSDPASKSSSARFFTVLPGSLSQCLTLFIVWHFS